MALGSSHPITLLELGIRIVCTEMLPTATPHYLFLPSAASLHHFWPKYKVYLTVYKMLIEHKFAIKRRLDCMHHGPNRNWKMIKIAYKRSIVGYICAIQMRPNVTKRFPDFATNYRVQWRQCEYHLVCPCEHAEQPGIESLLTHWVAQVGF